LRCCLMIIKRLKWYLESGGWMMPFHKSIKIRKGVWQKIKI
jgi:hypothetical protein